MSQTSIDYLLTVNIDLAYSDVRKLEAAIMKTLNIAERLTGDENLKQGIQTMQRAITTLRMLQVAYQAMQIARMSSGDPLAWFSAGATVATTALNLYDMGQM